MDHRKINNRQPKTVAPELIAAAAESLAPRDGDFLLRVYNGGLKRYRDRLAAIGFTGLKRVLDAGCGFGQWALALSELSAEVIGIDIDYKRVQVAARIAGGRANVSFKVASIESLPFADGAFDAVFCYSALYFTDVRRSVREISRVLRPGGKIYVCSNGFGWYLYNIVVAPNRSVDFSPRVYGLRALLATSLYRFFGIPPTNGGSVVTSVQKLGQWLDHAGISIVASGPEGTIYVNQSAPAPRPFFPGRYAKFECVSEWLGIKRH